MFGEHRFNREVRWDEVIRRICATKKTSKLHTLLKGESGGQGIYSINRSCWMVGSWEVQIQIEKSFIDWQLGTQACAHLGQFQHLKLGPKSQVALSCPQQSQETSPTLSGDKISFDILHRKCHCSVTRRARSWLFPVYVSQGGVSSWFLLKATFQTGNCYNWAL